MILFCDFDGTLYRPKIEGDFEANLAAIKKFRAAGHKFVMTTGRSLSSLEGVLPNYGEYFDYTISDNGAVCVGASDVEFEYTIPEEEQREITDFARSLPRGGELDFVYDRAHHGFSDIDGGTTKIRIWTVDMELMEEMIESLKERFGDKYVILGMRRAKPSLSFVNEKHETAVNIMSAEAGKERALARVAEMLGEEAFAVGDGGNDFEMLRQYDGYIMETAREDLRKQFDDSHTIGSVAELIGRLLIFDDVRVQLGENIARLPQIFYKDGATDATVFSVDGRYLIKITDELTLRTQREFLLQNTHPAFQKLLCWNDKLSYECFEFIEGEHFKKSNMNPRKVIEQIADIVAGYRNYPCSYYGFLGDFKKTWAEFLLDEIEYAASRIPDISRERAMAALEAVKKNNPKPEQYLMHGDFGAHNFLVNEDSIRVIDPMPVVGDKLYDFYFAVLSNTKIFADFGEAYIYSFFDEYKPVYKRALLSIALYVRMSRAAKYDKAHLEEYVKLYEEDHE